MRPNKCLYFHLSSSPGTAPATPCCNQLARAGQEHYDQFWNLLDGRVDGYNLDAGAFQSDVFKWSTQTNTAPKVATIPILDPTWNGTTTGGTSGGGGGSSGGYLRRKSSVGLEGVVDASDATNGRFCLLDKDYLSSQIISLIPADPASVANPGGTYKTPLGTTTFDTGGNFDVIFKRNSVEQGRLGSGEFVVNEDGLSTVKFRVEGDTNANLIYTDAVNDRVGIGTNAPDRLFDVNGNARIRATLAVNSNSGTGNPFVVSGSVVANLLYVDATLDRVQIGNLTSGKVPRATTSGALIDGTLSDDGTNVTASGAFTAASLKGTGLTSGKVPRATTGGLLTDGTLSDDGTNPSATTFKATTLQAKDTDGLKLAESGGTVRFTANGTGLAFFAGTPVAQQASAALTNNVTGGGDNDVIADYSSLTIYATDAAAIRNNLYQLARKVKEIGDALRTGKYNLLS